MPISPRADDILSSRPFFLVCLLITSLFHAPNDVINCLEKFICNFLWEGSCGDDGMHNVNWLTTLRPKLLGGLGIGNFCPRNSALLAKWK